MLLRKVLPITVAASLLVALEACGGADPSLSDFNKSEDPSTPAFENNVGGEAGLGTSTTSTPTGDLAACATQTATAEARPVYLVFMYDKSGSMGGGSPKWGSAKAAARGFFESADSKGISASLAFFPESNNQCSTSAYATPKVAMAALPTTALGAQLDQQSPGGNTPTYQAMQGAITYAQSVAAGQGKDGKVAIVLVTDGFPDSDCANTSVSQVKNLAASVASSIPTYVVGVGDALTNLNDIALGGGTKTAFVVSQSNSAQVQADFTKAMGEIKASALACDYKIPAAPPGGTFDRNKVNVQHSDAGAAPDTLQYNQGCTGGTGWKYDDASNPTHILLCDSTCDGIKGKAGKVDILYGCATQTGPVK